MCIYSPIKEEQKLGTFEDRELNRIFELRGRK
jgi:hypothetical protein